MIIENSFELPMSPAEAWPLLTDGALAVKLGPAGMRFMIERFAESLKNQVLAAGANDP